MEDHKQYGNIVGQCKICGINLWSKCQNKPAIFPCGIVARTVKDGSKIIKVENCPYETDEDRALLLQEDERSMQGSGLAAVLESGA